MPKPSISNIRSLGQLALSHRWEFDFTKFPTGITAAGIDSAGLNLRCESTTIPKATMSRFNVNIRGHEVGYNGITKFGGNIELTFIETINHEVANLLTQWREISYNVDSGKQSNKSDCEGIITLYLLDNQDNPKRKYTLIGTLLEDYTPGAVNNENDFIKPKITLWYDMVREESI